MRKLLVIGLALGLTTGAYATQDKLEGAEASVQITEQPQVIKITTNSAVLKWKTNSVSANNVLYRPVGTSEWKKAFIAQGSIEHWIELKDLKPSTRYEYQILTTTNKVRASGTFETPATNAANNSAAASTGTSTLMSANANANSDRVAIHRARHERTAAHAFVLDPTNVAAGFRVQGIVGYLLKNRAAGTAPLYAMVMNNDYFYTTSDEERQNALRGGYKDLGMAGWIATSEQVNTKPLYRLRHGNGQHFYSTDENEKNQAVSAGWQLEGIAGYVFTNER